MKNAKKTIFILLLIVILIASTAFYVLFGAVLSADLFFADYIYNLTVFSENGRKTVLESIPVIDEEYIEILTSGYNFGVRDSYSATLLRVPEEHKDDFEEMLTQNYTKSDTGPAITSMFLDLYKNDLLKKYSDIPHTSYFKHKDVAKSFVTIHSYDSGDGYIDYLACGEFDAHLSHSDVYSLVRYQEKVINPQKNIFELVISIVLVIALIAIAVLAASKAKKMSSNNMQDNTNDTKKSVIIIVFATITVITAILAGWEILTYPQFVLRDANNPTSVLWSNILIVFCAIQLIISEVDIMYNLYYYFFIPKENNTKTNLNGILFVLSSILFASLIGFIFFEKYALNFGSYVLSIMVYYIMRIIYLAINPKENAEKKEIA